MFKISHFWKTAIAASTIIFAVGCTSASSSAPFHMYSSPLLEGEMETPRTSSTGSDSTSSPGVQPRQVYVYQRWHPDGDAAAPVRRQLDNARPGGRQGPPLDTVDASSEPVLANYDGNQPSGAGRTVDDSGGEADGGSSSVQRSSTDHEKVDGDPAALAAEFIHTILAVNDIEFDDKAAKNIPQLYRQCRTDGEAFHSNQPSIGDLVFFHNTYDANEDGRNNDWYTLVGIIENIATDGTIEFLAYRGDGIETLYLHPDELNRAEGSGGRTINSELRTRSSDDPPFTQYLAGQLFAGYCNILGDRSQLILMDEWAPGMEL